MLKLSKSESTLSRLLPAFAPRAAFKFAVALFKSVFTSPVLDVLPGDVVGVGWLFGVSVFGFVEAGLLNFEG